MRFSIYNEPKIREHSFRAVYLITNLINKKIYIGSSENFRRRFRTYMNCEGHSRNATIAIYFAIRKHGFHNFEFEILERVDNGIELTAREQFWINSLSPFGENGYNLCLLAGKSARLGSTHTEDTKIKMKSAAKTRKMPLGWKENLGKAARARARDTSIRMGRPILQIDKNTLCVVNRFSSSECAEKVLGICSNDIRSAVRGKYISAGGFYWCEESVYLKQGFAPRNPVKSGTNGYHNIKPIIQQTMNGEFVKQWDSATQAATALNLKHRTIAKCCRHEIKSAYGYKWEFVTDASIINTVRQKYIDLLKKGSHAQASSISRSI